MKSVWLAQPNYTFGDNAFLPYSVGRLWAYAQQFDDICAEYRLAGLLPFRDPLDDVIERMRLAPPDVLGLSVYIWNDHYCLALALQVHIEFPECVIVMGGPQIPNDETLWEQWPADVLVRGEGEKALASVLRGVRPTTEFNRLETLDDLPSPYLTGVFDELLADDRYNWHALQETNRGCPYACTFCDWGSATFSQVREFPMSLVNDEIEWFAKHRIEMLYNCDANFGMLKRDEGIARYLKASKLSRGYPQKFRAAYAKKTTPRVFEVGKLLSDAGMSKGVTLSAQSMSKEVCKIIKRRPIDEPEYADLMKRYGDADVPTYTEIILGLPGETMASFKAGLCKLLDLGQHSGINVYPLIVLTNSELNEPAYRERYAIETVNVPMLLLHGSPQDDPTPERYDLVVSTSTMTREEWFECMIFAWVVQAFHCMGFLRAMADECEAGYLAYYESIIAEPGVGLIMQMQFLRDKLNGTLYSDDDDWNTVDLRFGDVTWPPEELFFMHCILAADTIYRGLGLSSDEIARCRAGYEAPEDYPDLKTWARETVWYGRKGTRKKAAA